MKNTRPCCGVSPTLMFANSQMPVFPLLGAITLLYLNFIHSSNMYLLSAYFVPSTVLGVGLQWCTGVPALGGLTP